MQRLSVELNDIKPFEENLKNILSTGSAKYLEHNFRLISRHGGEGKKRAKLVNEIANAMLDDPKNQLNLLCFAKLVFSTTTFFKQSTDFVKYFLLPLTGERNIKDVISIINKKINKLLPPETAQKLFKVMQDLYANQSAWMDLKTLMSMNFNDLKNDKSGLMIFINVSYQAIQAILENEERHKLAAINARM